MSSSRRNHQTQRTNVENAMIRRRDKQFDYDMLWKGQQQYYEHWTKANNKFNEWTSPRYYQTNNELMTEIKKERDHKENLLKRQEKLRKLLIDEEKSFAIELMMYRTNLKANKTSEQQPTTQVLKGIATSLQQEEDDRRRNEAELNLYRQWRHNNTTLKDYERKRDMKNLKLSWLDQQIEKQMEKEKAEEESRKILKVRNELLKKEQAKEEEFKKRIETKRDELKRNLQEQLDELKMKEELTLKLKQEEDLASRLKFELNEMKLKQENEEKRRINYEYALYNIRHYKLKLKEKFSQVENNLINEENLISELQESQIIDHIKNDEKRFELKKTIKEFLELTKEQKLLEIKRKNYLDLLFDSEAKQFFERQNELWKKEEFARMKLWKSVLDTIKQQIDENLKKNHNQQIEMLSESEELLKKIAEYNEELEELKCEETKLKNDYKNELNQQIEVKQTISKGLKQSKEMKRICEELENCRKEEERLKNEIMAMQNKQGPRNNRIRKYLY